jgi:hypothetical protein
MASPNSTFTELVSTTFRKHSKEIKDNVSKNNALLRRIYKKGNVRREDGGLSIVEPLDYAENSTYQRYSGYDVLNIGASDVISAAEFQWRQIAINVTASGLELRTNSGDSRIINLAKARLKNALRTFKNNFSSDMYSDGTASNQINGLQALVSNAGTGTVGGINSTTWTFWRNKVQSAAAPIQGGGAVTVSASTIEGQMMLPLWLNLVRGDDKPDLIVMDNNYFSFFEQSQVSIKRYTKSDTADAGFDALKYKGCDVMFDGNSGIPSNTAYFLNTDYLQLVVHKDADMEMPEDLRPYNQDAVVMPILWMGNLVVSNRALQGVMKA